MILSRRESCAPYVIQSEVWIFALLESRFVFLDLGSTSTINIPKCEQDFFSFFTFYNLSLRPDRTVNHSSGTRLRN